MDKPNVMLMTAEDIAAVAALETECFPEDSWSAAMFSEEILLENSHFFVLRLANKIIGYGGFWKILNEGHIMNIAVSPRHRGRGFGALLLSRMLESYPPPMISVWFLEVRVSNKPAIKLYEKFGFSGYHTRKKYYGDGEDALLMMKTLLEER